MQNPVAFNREIYNGLSVKEKFKHINVALHSIITVLHPTSQRFSGINLPYIEELKIELSEYWKMFDAVVGAFPEQIFCNEDINFIENSCKDTSCICEELENAITWLYIACDALKDGKKNAGRFDAQQRKEYYLCLKGCRTALTLVLVNFKDVPD